MRQTTETERKGKTIELKEYELTAAQDQEFGCEALDREPAGVELDAQFAQLEGEEVTTLRTESTKQFDLGESRYQAVLYPEPVHYRKAGHWEEIDNNLVEGESEGGRKVLRNRANALKCELPACASEGALMKLTQGGRSLSWQFERQAAPVAAEVRNGHELRRG